MFIWAIKCTNLTDQCPEGKEKKTSKDCAPTGCDIATCCEGN